MKVSVQISGFKELVGAIVATDVGARMRLAKQVDRSSAAVLAGAQARVPVGSGNDPHPGELKKSLRRKISRDGMVAFVMAGYGQMARKGAAAAARTRGKKVNQGKGVYAPAVEFGSVDSAAEPFMFPALNAEAQSFATGCGVAMHQTLGDVELKAKA